MDAWTRKHLTAWLEHQFTDEDERQAVERVMVDGYERDPVPYDRVGWWALYDDVRAAAVRAMLAIERDGERAGRVA